MPPYIQGIEKKEISNLSHPPQYFKSGEEIDRDLLTPPAPLEPIVSQFLYRKATTLLVADPGLGKSTVALNIAACVSSATPVFQKLLVTKPYRVCYLPFETDYSEFLEQGYAMREQVKVVGSNILWPEEAVLLGFNAAKPDCVLKLIQMVQAAGGCDLLIIDPLYLAVGGALEKSEPMIAFVRAVVTLRSTFNCSVLILHHTHREKHNAQGKVIQESDPFYGNIYLKAHVHASYLLKKQTEAHQGVVLVRKKDRGKRFLEQLTLDYHPDWMGLTMREKGGDEGIKERLLTYLRAQATGFETDFYRLADTLGCSHQRLRQLTDDPDITALVSFHQPDGKRKLWRVKSHVL